MVIWQHLQSSLKYSKIIYKKKEKKKDSQSLKQIKRLQMNPVRRIYNAAII